MIEYCYPECTTACVTALSVFKKKYPSYRTAEVAYVPPSLPLHLSLTLLYDRRVSALAIKYIHAAQREDGSWYGSWGICFTYATMFAIESLELAGENYGNSESVRRACDFLVGKQMSDGGWGESYKVRLYIHSLSFTPPRSETDENVTKSCETQIYVHHIKSQVVNTAWAVMALLRADYPDHEVIRRGCRLIMDRQLFDGSWAQEAIEGVFNKNCAIVRSSPLLLLLSASSQPQLDDLNKKLILVLDVVVS